MKFSKLITVFLALSLVSACNGTKNNQKFLEKKVEVGQLAPDFTAIDQNGKQYQLSQFRGKKNVVLAFYPKDMTPG